MVRVISYKVEGDFHLSFRFKVDVKWLDNGKHPSLLTIPIYKTMGRHVPSGFHINACIYGLWQITIAAI